MFTADGATDRGADHLPFELSHEQGSIGLFDTDGSNPADRLHLVIYGPQRDSTSQGLAPDGGTLYQFFTEPSPGVTIDSTPPTAPANLAFTQNTPTQNDLAWNASTDAESGVDHYNVYRNGVLLASPAGTTYSDTTVTAGLVYTYRVTAVNGDDFESGPSNSISIGTDTSPPSVPTNLRVGAASDISVTGGAVQVTLSWNAATDPESGIQHYKVYRNGTLLATMPTGTTLTDTALSARTTLEYRVSAVNNEDIESGLSSPLFIAQLQNGVSQNEAYNGSFDAWINETNPTQQNGDTTVLRVDGEDPAPNEQFILLKWNLATAATSIPSNAIVQRASVVANVTDNSLGQNYQIYPLLRDWVENQATFQIPRLGDDWEIDGARGGTDRGTTSLGTVGLAGAVPTRIAFPLNAAGVTLVDQWIDGASPNHGILLGDVPGGTANNALEMSSSEATSTQCAPGSAGTACQRPALLIVYTTPTATDLTPPSTPTGVAASDNGASQISLTWNPATDAESGIDHYKIYRDGALLGTSLTTSFTDATATPGFVYSYTVSAVNGELLEGAASTPVVHSIDVSMVGRTLVLSTRDSYLPGVPILVRVEIQGADGKPDRLQWDAGVVLTSSNPAVTLSADEVVLRNGLGSLLVTPTGSGPFTLSATVGGVTVQKSLTSLAGQPQTNVSGTLAGASTTWSGIIHVTDDVTVPAGHVLNIQPGTLILVDGDATPQSQTANSIIVQGTVHSLGTAASPVTFTAANPAAPWGEIFHNGSQPSDYTYTDITRAGHSTDQGHTSTGPAVRSANTTLTFDHVNITDITGKTASVTGGASSSLTFHDSHFARSVMGPEINDTAMLMEDHWFIDMLAQYREDGLVDDDDGIYIHSQLAGQSITMRRVVMANGEDDAIDTLASTLLLEDAIIRDWDSPLDDSKGVSISGGAVTIRRSLIVNNTLGVAAKALGNPSSINVIDRSTIVDNGVALERSDGATIEFTITNSILRGTTDTIVDIGNPPQPGSIDISYSNLGEAWPGTGNQTADPQFVDPAAHDYHLQPTSPAIDAGDPAASLDPDGSRADMGAFPFTHSAPASVTNVQVRSTAWSAAFLTRLAADGLGDGGYDLDHVTSGPAAETLPWSGIDQISVTFSDAVSVSEQHLSLHGVNDPEYSISGFSYDSPTRTATWTLAAPLAADKLALRLAGVTTPGGTPLDGDANGAYPSGDGTPGGDFALRFNVLVGDVNASGTTDRTDFAGVVSSAFRNSTSPSYVAGRDVDGNGTINYLDVIPLRDRLGVSLPAGEPAPSPSASPAASPVVEVELSPSLDAARVTSGPELVIGKVLRRSRARLSHAEVDAAISADALDDATSLRVLRAR
ncbi:MAG: DNRLRE domain-containing protein, partial [Pirellulales bacterium]